ncbi:hypothetical protein B0T18DRAFT_436944 [Schizothecium vesticola]|uniref:Protein kinase domain-containing protein n=1 Tax=Schizothecium vesticola TaxID=314040 RepID=A0AA40F1B6_9PEZI|nr:hypothetical protein B0T18DRAFT_436944 [Schizothecium vesticola]
MATPCDDKQIPGRLRYKLDHYSTHESNDDDTYFAFRRNGKAFYIHVLPSQFVDSPMTKEKWLSYLAVIRSGEDATVAQDTDIYEDAILDWVAQPFKPLFAELAPSPTPGAKLTLENYLWPDSFYLALDVVGEERIPRLVEGKRPPYLDDVETWTALYDPAGIVLSADDPESAFFERPRKVLIDNETTACFLKERNSAAQTKNELEAYKKMAISESGPRAASFFGLLLTYIDHKAGPLSNRVDPAEPDVALRTRWANQVEVAVSALHAAGIVWGDVKAENVLIDGDDNAWIIDFGGGYTRGWVDEKIAGTVQGDVTGLAKLREFIFQDENQPRWWLRQQ